MPIAGVLIAYAAIINIAKLGYFYVAVMGKNQM